jgi:amidase
MADTDYRTISKIAQKRRATNIAAYFATPPVDESDLPNNLTEYSLKSGYYTIPELEIIHSEAEDILQKIRDRIWTSLEVTQAFCKAAAYAQSLTNCVTEVLYAEALSRAQYLDTYLAEHGSPIGPLHGLPISLKDCFITAPHPSSIGMAAFANTPLQTDTLLVTILRDLGAVFYIKTNVPTAMMMMETNNNVWGETRNPLHKRCSPGGSSGGEGALLAFKASPLGVGTDIGGSVRIPAAWCGLYGLKPSFGRFPTYGGKSGIPGQEFILAVNGPMSRSLASVNLYCEAVLSSKVSPWNLDHKCLPLPWKPYTLPAGHKLRFGIITSNDGLVHVHPPITRALELTRFALEAAGHEVLPWATPSHPEIVKTLLAAFFDLGGTAIMDHLNPYAEPLFKSMAPYAAAASGGETNVGPTKMRMMNLQRNALQKAYLDAWMATATADKEPLDGIIMPVSPWAAPRLGQTQDTFYVGYTGVWNLLDFSACTFPVTEVDRHLDKEGAKKAFRQINELDGKIQGEYDAEFYHGAPVGLQMGGRRLEEEKVLEMTRVVAEALREYKLER